MLWIDAKDDLDESLDFFFWKQKLQ